MYLPGTQSRRHQRVVHLLSGSVSDSNYSVFTPGSLFFNPPEKAHRMTTGDFEPTLLAYAWTGTPEKLANQRMSFAGRKS